MSSYKHEKVYKVLWRSSKLDNPNYNPRDNKKTLVKDYLNYTLMECEEPYDYTETHLILRDKGRDFLKVTNIPQYNIKLREKESILKEYKKLGYAVVENPENHKSVLEWEHIHLLRFILKWANQIL